MPQSVFIPSGEPGGFVATELARGPWDPQAQHGGAPAALLMREFERLPGGEGLQLVRVTYELLRPVPLGELTVAISVARPGRRVQLLEASLSADGVEVVRARALRVARADAPAAPVQLPPRPPEESEPNDFVPPHRPMFAPDTMELRFAAGRFTEPGPATVWFRLKVPLVAGEEPSALQRLAAAGDFGNGVASPAPWPTHVFINPDLTLYVERPPRGEWIALQARSWVAPDGVGLSESVLFDLDGRVGRATQALLVAPRPT